MKPAKKETTKYVVLTAILSAISIIFLLRTFFLENYYFFSRGIMSDLLRANLPTYYQLFDNIASGGSFWTWHIGIGASMFTHADVVMDPFTYILFLRGRDFIPDMFIWVQVVKTICTAVAAYFYLSWFKFDRRVCLLCANLYAISGILIFQNNFALGTVCVYCPLYLLGVEYLLEKKDFRLAVFALLATCLYSYYFFYVSGVLCAIYLVVRLLMRGANTVRQFAIPILMLLGIGIVCMGLSAFFLLPQIELVLNSVRTTSGKDVALTLELLDPSIKNLLTSISRVFQLNLLGDGVNQGYVGSANDYFQFTTYITAAAIPLMVQFWMGAKKKARIWFAVIVSLCCVGISVPLFAYGMNMFSSINYRWMFIVNLLLAVACALGIQSVIDHKGFYRIELYLSLIAAVEIVVASTYLLRTKAGVEFLMGKKPWVVIALVLGAMVLLDLYISTRGKRTVNVGLISCVLFCVMLIEADMNYRPWYHDEPVRWGYHADENIYDGTDQQIVEELMEEDPGFYRIQKDFDPVVDSAQIESLSDAMAQGYYGLEAYCSLNNAQYVRFLMGMDLFCYPFPNLQNDFEAQIMRIEKLSDGSYLILNNENRALALDKELSNLRFEKVDERKTTQRWKLSPIADVENGITIISAKTGKPVVWTMRESDGQPVLTVGESDTTQNAGFVLSLVGLNELTSESEEMSIRNGYYRIFLVENGGLVASRASDDGAILGGVMAHPSSLSGSVLNYISGVYEHYDLMSYLGVKYFVSRKDTVALPNYFSLVKEQAGYKIYQNDACYPLAFETDEIVSLADFMKLYGTGKEKMLLNASVLGDGQTKIDADLQDIQVLAQKKRDAFTLHSFSADRVEFELQLSENAEYLNLTIPYDKDWRVEIDGEPVQTQQINVGLLGVELEENQKGRSIYVCAEYAPRAFYIGLAISLATCAAVVLGLMMSRKGRKKDADNNC